MNRDERTKLVRLIELSAELDAKKIKEYLDQRKAPDNFIKAYLEAFNRGVRSALMTIEREIGKKSKE